MFPSDTAMTLHISNRNLLRLSTILWTVCFVIWCALMLTKLKSGTTCLSPFLVWIWHLHQHKFESISPIHWLKWHNCQIIYWERWTSSLVDHLSQALFNIWWFWLKEKELRVFKWKSGSSTITASQLCLFLLFSRVYKY
jgi:hypothetical protein